VEIHPRPFCFEKEGDSIEEKRNLEKNFSKIESKQQTKALIKMRALGGQNE